MTTTNQNTAARRAELRCKVAELATIYRANSREVVKTSGYTYSDLQWNDTLDCLMFVRNGERICVVCALPDGKGYDLHNYDNPHHRVYFGRLPKFFQELIRYQMVILGNIRAREAEIEALDAEESDELPPPPATVTINDATPAEPVRKTVNLVIKKGAPMVEAPLNETVVSYDYADTIRNTLAERVESREVIEGAKPDILGNGAAMFVGYGAGAFADALNICGISYVETGEGSTPAIYIENFEATMEAVDNDLADDLNGAFEEIKPDSVDDLLKYADDSEREGFKAKAAAYRAVARLAALHTINDAIEDQPELEGLLASLFDWANPVQLPANVAKDVSDTMTAARRVFDISCLSSDDMSERSRLFTMDSWALELDYYRGMDDDLIKAFSIHAAAGLWIQYFKQTWMFVNDGVVDASSGAFYSQPTVFVGTLSRYLAPDIDDLY